MDILSPLNLFTPFGGAVLPPLLVGEYVTVELSPDDDWADVEPEMAVRAD